ncbi:MAG: 50S ribosomal protein L23 [bacterium]
MALFDFLKRKKSRLQSNRGSSIKSGEVEKAKEGKRAEKKTVKKAVDASVEKKDTEVEKEAVLTKTSSKKRGFAYEAINKPHISEKATYLSEKSQYTFKVAPDYNKKEIKSAVEGIYGVDVLSVNVIKIPSKKRRLGKTQGFKKGYTKAVVKIKEGQKIEIL